MDEIFPKIKRSIENFLQEEEGNITRNRVLMVGSMMILMGILFSQDALAGHRSHSSHKSHSSHSSHSSGSGGGHVSHSSHESHASHASGDGGTHSSGGDSGTVAPTSTPTPTPTPTPVPSISEIKVPRIPPLNEPITLPDISFSIPVPPDTHQSK